MPSFKKYVKIKCDRRFNEDGLSFQISDLGLGDRFSSVITNTVDLLSFYASYKMQQLCLLLSLSFHSKYFSKHELLKTLMIYYYKCILFL